MTLQRFGAVATFIVMMVFAVTKFPDGAQRVIIAVGGVHRGSIAALA